MSLLGLYFGTTRLGLVECTDKKIVKQASVAVNWNTHAQDDNKVLDESSLIKACKDELSKNNFNSEQAVVILSGKDLIIRTFDIPVLPPNEVDNAVNFEVKKYIPFKVDELIFDYQLKYDRSTKKNFVLFVGIKKQMLDKYFSVMSQLQLKVERIEYAQFSMLRVLRSSISEKGIEAIINVDGQEHDEANFIVLENGFPLFCRDILISENDNGKEEDKEIEGLFFERLKAELRVSLDFYLRKFSTKRIEKMYFLVPEAYQSELSSFLKEWNMTPKFIDDDKIFPKSQFSLSVFKAYGGVLFNSVKGGLKIDILAAHTKNSIRKEDIADVSDKENTMLGGLSLSNLRFDPSTFFSDIFIDYRIVSLCVIACVGIIVFGHFRISPLESAIKEAVDGRPKLISADANAKSADLSTINSNLSQRFTQLTKIFKDQTYVTDLLAKLPALLPEGVWLNDMSYRKDSSKSEVTLSGVAYLESSVEELQMINTFLSNLQSDKVISSTFKQILIDSAGKSSFQKTQVTSFVIIMSN